jgi:hypothetical protein
MQINGTHDARLLCSVGPGALGHRSAVRRARWRPAPAVRRCGGRGFAGARAVRASGVVGVGMQHRLGGGLAAFVVWRARAFGRDIARALSAGAAVASMRLLWRGECGGHAATSMARLATRALVLFRGHGMVYVCWCGGIQRRLGGLAAFVAWRSWGAPRETFLGVGDGNARAALCTFLTRALCRFSTSLLCTFGVHAAAGVGGVGGVYRSPPWPCVIRAVLRSACRRALDSALAGAAPF